MNTSFQRKIVYLVLIGVLLVPVALIGRPAADAVGGGDNSGGKLAELRSQYHLGQAQLGKIDPTSSAVRYVSLGLHGVAVCVLQNKAHDYQKQEDWITLMAVLNQLTYLQPYYVKVWTHQSWNISYNVANKLDDYREKYDWSMRGFKLLRRGMQFNELEPMFPYEMGWAVGHKFGQDDNREAFRRLFRDDRTGRTALVPDSAIHDAAWTEEGDNWLFAKRFLLLGEDMVDNRGAVLRSMGPENFFFRSPMHQKECALGLEREGTFGTKAANAWRETQRDLSKYAGREFPSNFGGFYRLDGVEALVAKKQALEAQVASLPRDGDEARRLRREMQLIDVRISEISTVLQAFPVDYWLMRAELETTDDALQAREFFYKALRDVDDRPLESRRNFEQGFGLWRKIWDEPRFAGSHDDQTTREMFDVVNEYLRLLRNLNVRFDREDFVLKELYDLGVAKREIDAAP